MITWWTWYHGVDDDAEHEQVVRQVRCQIAFSTLQWYFHHHQHNYFPHHHHHHHRKWPHDHHQHRPNRRTATLMVAICAPEKYAPVMHWYASAVALQARTSDFNQGANYNHLHVISSTAQIAQMHIYLLPLHIIFTDTHAWYKVHCKWPIYTWPNLLNSRYNITRLLLWMNIAYSIANIAHLQIV